MRVPGNVDSVLVVNGEPTNWKANAHAMQSFMDLAIELNEIFIVLFHLGGGPPARGTELFTMTYRNGEGTKRTLFAPEGKLFWILEYSKVGHFL